MCSEISNYSIRISYERSFLSIKLKQRDFENGFHHKKTEADALFAYQPFLKTDFLKADSGHTFNL